jgi:alpha-galactosidase
LNDPDVVFCREKGIEYGEKEKELIAVVDRLLASQIMFSDDASEFGSQGERAFTARIIELYDRLRKSEFGAERLDREVFSLFSRDGRYEGYINLRDSAYAVRDARAESLDPATAILCRASRIAGGLALEPRSISLFVH